MRARTVRVAVEQAAVDGNWNVCHLSASIPVAPCESANDAV